MLRRANGGQDPREAEASSPNGDADPKPAGGGEAAEHDEEVDDGEEAAENDAGDDGDYFPVSHEVIMKDHTKVRSSTTDAGPC